ncbi:hypothetical protein JXI42_07855 [bacterium]|nr:hypothetical protein [bacterium]
MEEDRSTKIAKTVTILFVIYSLCFVIVLFSKNVSLGRIDVLNESTVEEFISKVNNAIKNKDSNFIINAIAEDADIEIQLENHSICPDKNQFKQKLCSSFRTVSSYFCETRDYEINIENDTARVIVNKHETIKYKDGREFTGFKKENMDIALVNGELKLTSYRTKSSLD